MGVILAVNKHDSGADHDIFYEECYTEVRGLEEVARCAGVAQQQPRAAPWAGSTHAPALPPPQTLQSDTKAMALFAHELGQVLGDRALECALASAMSIVSCSHVSIGQMTGTWGPLGGCEGEAPCTCYAPQSL